jgi:hypothetical protein
MKLLMNDPYELVSKFWLVYGGIPMSSYDNLGEDALRFGRKIVTWYLMQASSVVIVQ